MAVAYSNLFPGPELVDDRSRWYAVRVRSNAEKAVHAAFLSKDFESFLPTYRIRRRWSDRVKELDAPLFPGYTFCRFNCCRRVPILTTPGVVSIVSSSQGPLEVDERELAAVRSMVSSGTMVGPWPFLREGEFVEVERGPLAGVEGIIVSLKGEYRLVVSVAMLQRSVAVEIERGWVKPVSSHRLPS